MENTQQTRPRRVMIGTPSYDGTLEVYYVNSILEATRQGMARGIEIFPIWLSYDALIQRARNDLMALMLEMQCDDIIFIDSDIEFQADWIFKLLDYPVDVVGGTYPKKGDEEMYVVKMTSPNVTPDPATGLLSVDGLGTGFVRLSRFAVQTLWDNSPAYEEREYNKTRRLIFNVVVENGSLISEDIWMFKRLNELGIPVWFDKTMTCNHVGTKKYTGNFEQWFARLQQSVQKPMNPRPPQANYGTNKLNRFIQHTDVKSLYK